MPTITETFVATASLSDTNYVLPKVTESFGGIEETLHVTTSSTFSEQFVAGDGVALTHDYLRVSETFAASDAATGSERREVNVLEQFAAGDSVISGVQLQGTLSETFTALAASPVISRSVTLSETFAAADSVQPGGTTQVTVLEQFVADDSVVPLRRETVTEQFTATSSAWGGGAFVHAVEQFTAADRVVIATDNDFVSTRETFTVRSDATPTSKILAVNTEQFFVSSRTQARDQFELTGSLEQAVPFTATSAWVADTRSWGMSRYVGLPVNDFVNNQFGVGPDGVHAASTDPVMAFLETGDVSLMQIERDIPDLRKKRLHFVYGYGRQTAPLDFRVEADYNGERRTEIYEQESRDALDDRGVRCQVGRGFASNYIRLRFGGVVDFDLAGLEAEVSPTSRRV